MPVSGVESTESFNPLPPQQQQHYHASDTDLGETSEKNSNFQVSKKSSAATANTTNSSNYDDNNFGDEEEEDIDDFPDGGLKAWKVVFGAWCAMVSTFGIVNSAGFLQAWLTEHQLKGTPESKISWIFSVYSFLFFFGGVQVGPVFDTYGLKFVLLPGCIGVVLSIFFLSLSTQYYQFMLGYGVLGGFSASLVFTPAIASVGHWFHRRRGLATGIAETGGAVGGLVFPLAMNKMMPEIGYGWTIRVIGFIILALVIGTMLTLRTRLPLNKKAGAAVDFKALKDPRFAFTCLGTYMLQWGIFIPLNYITTYALAHGVKEPLAYQILPFLAAGSIFGRSLPAYVADLWGRFNVMVVTAIVTSAMCLALWLPAGSNLAAIISFAVLFGFWSGTGICLTPVCVSQVCKTEDYGKRYGTCYFFVSFGVLTGLPIAGEIMKRQDGSYQGLIIFAGVTYFFGAVAFAIARVLGGGTRLNKIY